MEITFESPATLNQKILTSTGKNLRLATGHTLKFYFDKAAGAWRDF